MLEFHSSIFTLQLNEDDPPKQITKPVKKTKQLFEPMFDPKYIQLFERPVKIKELQSQVMVDGLAEHVENGEYFDSMIKNQLAANMMHELVRRIKVEKMPNEFTEYGQTMYKGTISVVE